MHVVATDVLNYIENQFRIGRNKTDGLEGSKPGLTEASYSRTYRGTRGKFTALCHLLSVLHPQPKPTLWAIMLEARSSIEVALAKETSSYFDQVVFDGNPVTPLVAIVEILRQTPDQMLPSREDRLSYVADLRYRDQLLFDLAVASSALDNREWKASVVIAGSVVEALLLNALLDAGVAEPKLYKMSFDDLIKESNKGALIDKSLTDQLQAVRDYRNLIHPGRAIRERETCTPGKAYAMFGALHLLDEQLSKLGGA